MENKAGNLNKTLTLLFFSLVLFAFIVLLFLVRLSSQLVILGLAGLTVLAWNKQWSRAAQVLTGLTLFVGTEICGIALYIFLSGNLLKPVGVINERPYQHFDFIITGPIVSLLFTGICLFFYYVNNESRNVIWEKKFSTVFFLAFLCSFVTHCFYSKF